MPHITRDIDALIEREPASLDELLSWLESLGRWQVLRSDAPEAHTHVRDATAAMLDMRDADAEPTTDGRGFDVSWHARSWVLRGIAYPDPEPSWSPDIDPSSPVALVVRHKEIVIVGPAVVRLAQLALGSAFVTRWLRAAAAHG